MAVKGLCLGLFPCCDLKKNFDKGKLRMKGFCGNI